MRLKITLESVKDPEVTEVVLAGMVVARRWEEEHGEAVSAKLETHTPTAIVELAHLAYNRKHGKHLTISEFEDEWEPTEIDAGGGATNPSDPATAPS